MSDEYLSDADVGIGSSTAPKETYLSDADVGLSSKKSSDSGIVGSVEYDTSHRASDAPAGPLTRTEDDGVVSGLAKGTATGLMRGIAGIPGKLGDERDFGRYLADRALGFAGYTPEEINQNRKNKQSYLDDLGDWIGEKTGFYPRLPNTDTFANPVEEYTGRYDPESSLGRIAQGTLEAAVSSVGPGGQVIKARPNGYMRAPVNAPDAPRAAGMEALKAPLDTKLAAAGAGTAALGSSITEFTGDPLWGFAANFAAGPAVHYGSNAVKATAGPAWARFSPEYREQMAAEQLRGYATDPDKFTDSVLNRPDKDRVLENSPLTTGQAHGDAGILEAERQFRADDDFKHRLNEQEAEQNNARVGALRDIPNDSASSHELVRSIEDRHNAITERYNQAEEKLRAEAESRAAELGDKADPMEVGASLREEIQKIRAQEQAEISKLYDAVDPNGELLLLTTPLKEGLAEIKARETTSTEWEPSVVRAMKLAKDAPEVWSLRELRGLDTELSGYMAKERMNSGESNSWSALKILKGKVKDAINNAVENQIAWEKAAGIKPEDGIEGRIGQSDVGAGVSRTEGDAVAGARAVSGEAPLGNAREGLDQNAGVGETRAPNGGSGNTVGGQGLAEEAGRDNKIFYPGGNISAKYEVVDLDSLISSHGNDFNENPNYPQNLQPRDRGAKPAQDQVNNLSSKLNPEQLGKSAEANTGAPIVGPDGIVESGNGRTLAISKNYAAGDPRGYRAWLESQGFDVSGMKNPVLIARRTTDLSPSQREFFTQSANSSTGLRMRAGEQGAADAKFLTPETLSKLRDGSLTSGENADFINSLMSKIPVNERAAFADENSNISQAGLERLRAAIMSSAYGDADIVKRAFESTDNNIKNITGALTDASGSWAKMRSAAKEGDISPDHDVTKQLLNTVKKIMKARDEGRPLGEVLSQKDLLEGDTPALVEALLIKDGKVVSRKQIAKNLESYAQEALKNESGPGLFGDQVSPDDILRTVGGKEQLPPDTEAAPKVEGPKTEEQGTFASGAGEDTRPKPNMTKEAAETLSTANKRYGEYAQTYRKGDVGSVLRTTGFKDQYQVKDSAIAAKAVRPGDTGYETASNFMKAANNSPDAVSTMKEMLLNHFRNAVGSDGILNSKNYDKLVKKYDGAIRAIEERSPGFMEDVSSARKASDMLDAFVVRRKEAIDALKKEAAGRFMGLKDDADIAKEAGILIDGSSATVQKMRSIVKDLPPDAKDGLQRATIDWMLEKKTNPTTAGMENSEFALSKRFSKMIKEKRAILEELFTPEQIDTMDAIARDMAMSERSVQATKDRTNPSGSGRTAAQHIKDAVTEIGSKSVYAIALSSLMSAYETGGVFGVAKLAPTMIAGNVLKSTYARGKASINDVVAQAILDPQMARELFKKLPPKESQIYSSSDSGRKKAVRIVFNSLMNSLYRYKMAFPAIAEDDNQRKRLQRKAGGRVGVAMTPEQVIAGLERACKEGKKVTESILNKSDEAVVRALNIADQHI
jgi:hypothetical protein